jgi:multisubunit Na+/H+ antiporter MnhB subunit
MPVRTLRGKRGRCRYPRTDRAVAAAVVLAVTIVLVLIGFSGSSVEVRLPEPAGWLYIGVVIVLATLVLAWLFWVDGERRRATASGLRTVNSSSKRIPLG